MFDVIPNAMKEFSFSILCGNDLAKGRSGLMSAKIRIIFRIYKKFKSAIFIVVSMTLAFWLTSIHKQRVGLHNTFHFGLV